MDKIKLINLGVLPKLEETEITIGDSAVTVKRRVTYEQILEMIQWCIDFIINDRPFVSEPISKIIKEFAILKWYTNLDIDFIEEYREIDEIYENYDLVSRYGIVEKVKVEIDKDQMNFFEETLEKTLHSITKYRNSAKGILDAVTAHSKEDVEQMQEALDLIGDEEQNKKIANLIQLTKNLEET